MSDRRLGPLCGWLAGLSATILVLTALGRGALAAPPLTDPASWSRWAAGRPALDVAMTVGRVAVLAVAWYLTGVTTVGIVARILPSTRFVAAADALTLPAVRRLLQAALGLGLATASLAATTRPVPAPGPPRVAVAAAATASGTATMRLVPDEPRPQPAPPLAPTGTGAWSVRPGDNLWAMAARRLEAAWGRPATDAEIVPYWEAVIRANRDRLADPANPDLVFAGQVFDLPTPPQPSR